MTNTYKLSYDQYNEPYVAEGKDYPNILKFVKNAIPLEVIKIMDIEFTLMKDYMQKSGRGFKEDATVENSFSWYSPLCFDTLSLYMQPFMEEQVGAKLYPTYSYARIYMNGSELQKHTDRKSSQVTASCCIRKEEGIYWPLCFETKDGIEEFDMEPGDLVISSGTKIPHWRTPYTGKEHMQAFIQYVYSDGKYQNLKYDTRPCLAAGFEETEEFIKAELERRRHQSVID